jgi:hypothetical protein
MQVRDFRRQPIRTISRAKNGGLAWCGDEPKKDEGHEAMGDNGKLVDAKQAAILLDVSDRTIRRWKQAGCLPEPAVRVNRKCLWRYDDLERLIFKRTEADKSGQGG